MSASGPTCGPRLSGLDQPNGALHVVQIDVDAGFLDAAGIAVLGLSEISVPIPFYGCTLLTDPAIVLPFQTDATGRARVPIVFPRTFVGTFFAQAATFTLVPNALVASDRARIECRER